MNYSKTSNSLRPYPTRSLREFLAHQSLSVTPSQESQLMHAAVQIELDVGDGRREVLSVDSNTDIQAQAQAFCTRYHLQDYVKELLAQSIRNQYERESQQSKNKRQAKIGEQLRDIYANSTAREVLIGSDSLFPHEEPNQRETKTYQSQHSPFSLHKKDSIGLNKENKPSINGVSQLICDKLGKENIINFKKQRSTERLKALKREKEQKEAKDMEQCLFHPKINMISERVDRQITSQSRQDRKIERYQLLYQNFKQLESKRMKLREEAQAKIPFQPAINLISKKIVEGRKLMEASQCSKEAKNSGHEECMQQKRCSRPKTGRNPMSRNKQGLPIGEYLYRQAAKRHSRPPAELKQQVKALDYSDYLVTVLKEKKLKEIFIELTVPPHITLSPEDINALEQIELMHYRLLRPLLQQIVQIGACLNEQEFIQAGLNLINSLTPEERYELVFRKKSEENPDLSLQCTITRNHVRNSNEEDLYSRGRAHHMQKQERLERSREERVRSELRGCTFRPYINK